MKSITFVFLIFCLCFWLGCSNDKKVEAKSDSPVFELGNVEDSLFSINKDDSFVVLKQIEIVAGITRIAVKRNSDGEVFSAFWQGQNKVVIGQGVTLISYSYNHNRYTYTRICLAFPK
jgi:hypothetical protein